MRKTLLLTLIALAGALATGLSQHATVSASTTAEILKSSTDREALERTAVALARSDNPGDLTLLGQLLRERDFLARLDDLKNQKTRHLSRVIAALAEHPTPQTVEIALALAEDPVFVAEGDRKSFVLELLAKVRPMNERTAGVFQRSNEEGYFAFNARLLGENGSPRALALFESMMLDRQVPAESRIECLHVSIVPHRVELQMLRSADRILSRASERAIAAAVVESVFDFKQQWFNIESGISEPPPWQSASTESLRSALALAEKGLGRGNLSPALRGTVSRARDTIAKTLAVRQK
jgi:hypothetical protein